MPVFAILLVRLIVPAKRIQVIIYPISLQWTNTTACCKSGRLPVIAPCQLQACQETQLLLFSMLPDGIKITYQLFLGLGCQKEKSD